MRLLLDTHVWLWRLIEPERLSPLASQALDDPASDLHLSPITVWETLVLARKGRLRLEPSPDKWVETALRRSATTMVPLTHAIARRSEQLEGYDAADPADRFLVATALVEELRLVTADRAMRGYGSLETVW